MHINLETWILNLETYCILIDTYVSKIIFISLIDRRLIDMFPTWKFQVYIRVAELIPVSKLIFVFPS